MKDVTVELNSPAKKPMRVSNVGVLSPADTPLSPAERFFAAQKEFVKAVDDQYIAAGLSPITETIKEK